MAHDELLQEYSESIRTLRKQCRDAGMTDEEFRKLYFESLKSLEIKERLQTDRRQRFNMKYQILLAGVVIALCIVYNFKIVYSGLQEYIYPGLRFLRRLSIPFISLFPSLTELYHETCLIQNPFFTVVDMDCWPCSTVSNVREVYDPTPILQQQNAPFVYETDQKIINRETLKDLYLRHKNVFNKDSPKIFVNSKYYVSPEEMFHTELPDDKNLYVWKINNMDTARLLRQIIPRPKVVPKFGQSTERFIIVDSSQGSFHIPDTECHFSFLLSLSGSRTVALVPAEECKHQCKSLKIELKETYLLWYNWWYWRPVVQPSTGNMTLIAHVGSYC